MVPLFVLILIAAVLWRQRHRPTAKRLFVATLFDERSEFILFLSREACCV